LVPGVSMANANKTNQEIARINRKTQRLCSNQFRVFRRIQ